MDGFENMIAILGMTRFLEVMHPRIVTIEETSGLKELKKHKANMQCLLSDFTASNYSVRWKVVNMAEHGLPQRRRRLIVFAAA